jgi:hypothetical protein
MEFYRKTFCKKQHLQQASISCFRSSVLYLTVFRCLKLKPKDRKCNDEKEDVSLMLVLAQSSVKLDTDIEASFKFLIYDQCYGKHMEQLGNITAT